MQSKSDSLAVSLRLSQPADLNKKMRKLQLAIACRAHELFEARGRVHGHDVEDWRRAECELLCPISVWMAQSVDRVLVRAKVAGFGQNELEVSVEPRRVTIFGKKKAKKPTAEQGSYPDQILAVLDLATEVIPERTIVKAQPGVLKCELVGSQTAPSLM